MTAIEPRPIRLFCGEQPLRIRGRLARDRADPLGLWTVSIGVSVNGMWGPGGVGGSAGIVIDGSGNVAVYTTKGGGVGAGEERLPGGFLLDRQMRQLSAASQGPSHRLAWARPGVPACRATSTLGLAQMECTRLEVGMGT